MPHTPGGDDLPYVKNEAETIARITDDFELESISLKHPNIDTILEKLPLYRLVHFACHGLSDHGDPSLSHLVLNDGKLTVSRILKSHIAEPEVAFLSACSTAKSYGTRLTDESIHIASSFQQIGFQHVVGTLWSSDDKTCSEVSGAFYRELFANSETHNEWKVADALHLAIKSVRDRHPDFPLIWAPYIVFGG